MSNIKRASLRGDSRDRIQGKGNPTVSVSIEGNDTASVVCCLFERGNEASAIGDELSTTEARKFNNIDN